MRWLGRLLALTVSLASVAGLLAVVVLVLLVALATSIGAAVALTHL